MLAFENWSVLCFLKVPLDKISPIIILASPELSSTQYSSTEPSVHSSALLFLRQQFMSKIHMFRSLGQGSRWIQVLFHGCSGQSFYSALWNCMHYNDTKLQRQLGISCELVIILASCLCLRFKIPLQCWALSQLQLLSYSCT